MYALEKIPMILPFNLTEMVNMIFTLPNLIDPILNDEADFTVGSRFLDESNSGV